MKARRCLLIPLTMVFALVSCGGGDTGDEPSDSTAQAGAVSATDTTVRPPERTTSDDTMPVPAGFPAPFMGGGGFVFESEDEIRMAYSPDDYQLLIDFYQHWSLGQSHRLIDNNPDYTWDFPDFTIKLEANTEAGTLVTIKRDS